METTIWEIYAKCSTSHIVGIYRPPASSKHAIGNQDFINKFSDLVSYLSLGLQNVVYLGDFIIHINSEICNDAQQFKDTIDILGLQQHVFVPMHNSGNTLDLIMTEYFSTVKITEFSQAEFLSDHCLIFGKINLAPQKYKTTLIKFQNFKNADIDRLIDDIHLEDFTSEEANWTLDKILHAYKSKSEYTLDLHAPVKSVNKKIVQRNRWYTDHHIKFTKNYVNYYISGFM